MDIQHDDGLAELRGYALQQCQKFLGGAWESITDNDVTLSPLNGISNSVFCCELPEIVPTINGEPSRVLIRFYGQNNNVHELENQVKVFKIITRKELGPKLFGEFEGGRLEEFLPARPLNRLNSKDPQISAIVAKRLATIHNLDVPIQKCNTWLVNKYEEFLDYINDNIKLFDEHELQSSTKLIAKQMLLIDFSEEIRFLGDQFEKSTSPIVFSHNDLHRGNILFTEVSKTRSTLADRIVLIDFEYSSYNYRGYDIANYFLEAAFEYEPSKYPFFSYSQDRFPSKSECLTFIRHYLNKMSKLNSRRRSTTSNSLSSHHFTSGDNMLNYEILCKSNHDAKNPNSSGETYEEKVLQELEPFLMASHLFWILWSIKNGITSDKSFGFWEYALCRWKCYLKLKQEYLKDEINIQGEH